MLARRTTSTALGTKFTGAWGRTSPERPPRSSGLKRASKLSRTERPPRPRIRGATAPTRGSWNNAPSRRRRSTPSSTSTSASINATSGRVVARRPVLRAALGPRLWSWRQSVAPRASTSARSASGSSEPSSTTVTCSPVKASSRAASESAPSRTGMTTSRSSRSQGVSR